jgi:hypothetical protein
MVYNLSNITSNTTITGMFQTANSFSEGYLGVFILLAVFIVSWASMGWYKNSQAFAAAAFLTALEALVMIGLQMIGGKIALLCWICFAAGSLFLIKSEE